MTTTPETSGGVNTAALIKRIFMFLEDGDFQNADAYCERVLDSDPECAEAYLGKLMVEQRVRQQEQLMDCRVSFEDSNNYRRVVRFGDEMLVATLQGYVAHINRRNQEEQWENAYADAVESMNAAATELAYTRAAERFAAIAAYKDAAQLEQVCRQQAESCRQQAEVSRKEAVYTRAQQTVATGGATIAAYQQAMALYATIPDWRDAGEQIAACETAIEAIKAKAEADRLAREQRAAKRAKRRKRLLAIGIPTLCVVAAVAVLLPTVIIPTYRYNKAISLMEAGEYERSLKMFISLDGYKDSAEYIQRFDVRALWEKEVYGDTVRETTYDEKGNLLKSVTQDDDGNICSTEENTYDEKGNLLKSVTQAADGRVTTEENTYDEEGNEIKSIYKNADGAFHQWEYVYDENGKMIESIGKNADGSTYSSEQREYDQSGKRTQWVIKSFDASGNVLRITTWRYTYDDKGKISRELSTSNGSNGSDGYECIRYYTYEYFENGDVKRIHWEETRTYEGQPDEYSMGEDVFDENGNWIRWVEETDNYKQVIDYTYDNNGKRIKETAETHYKSENTEDTVSETRYTYDEYGCLVKETGTSKSGSTTRKYKTTYERKDIIVTLKAEEEPEPLDLMIER